MDIQYAYSSNLQFKTTGKTPLKKPQVLAMAYTDDQVTQEASNDGFYELPYSSLEVDLIGKLFGSSATTMKGADATKNAFLSAAPQMDILHLAIHGIGDTLSPVHSHLIFNHGTSEEDSRLFAHALYNLPPNHWRLVVLSACETGVGKSLEGEGTFSIARGFAYAGAPSLVMSLWNVNDQATARIMDRFYRHLRKGRSASKALQQAKIDFLDEQNPETFRPFFWAGLVATGDESALIKPDRTWYYFLTFTLALIFLYLFLHRKGN
jgi:CHAT domain-containing protein